jgi:hypothetical protein
VTVDDDQSRPVIGRLEDLHRSIERIEVIGITDSCDVPAIPQETGGDIVGVGEFRVPFDRDVVVVVDPTEVGQLEVPGE